MQQLVLSIFPGVDLLGMAFKREGFCVVQGGDPIFGGDIREEHYPPGRFDGVIGGPPCQAFSRMVHMVRHNGLQPTFGNLIPEFERVVSEVKPAWFLMEEVPDAPLPKVAGYEVWSTLLNNRQCMDEDGKPAKQNRVRRFSFGAQTRTVLMIDVVTFDNPVFEYAALGGSHAAAPGQRTPIKLGGSGKLKRVFRERERERERATTLPWNAKSTQAFFELCKAQGLPEGFDITGFTVQAKCKAVGNGVPLPMGRAIARAVKEAIGAHQPAVPR